MNSTKWVSLTEFVKYLGKEGVVRVDETEKGFFISWVDNSPGALARQVSPSRSCPIFFYSLSFSRPCH